MMSAGEIERINRKATREAAADARVPEPVWPQDADALVAGRRPEHLHIPFVGNRTPRGYKRIEDVDGDGYDAWFVDKSGFGEPGEPALTMARFGEELQALAARRGKWDFCVGVVEEGPFQVYVGAWERRVKGGK